MRTGRPLRQFWPPSPQPDSHSADNDIIAHLKALDRANVGRTISDDEMVGYVCESAIEEIQLLRSGLLSVVDLRQPQQGGAALGTIEEMAGCRHPLQGDRRILPWGALSRRYHDWIKN